jgi:transcriptional regulator with XRE-family HTH domain
MGSEHCTRLGARIRALRKAKGWRLVDLAQHSGIKEVHLSHLERGTREVGFNALVAIAQGLEVSLSELLKGIERADR